MKCCIIIAEYNVLSTVGALLFELWYELFIYYCCFVIVDWNICLQLYVSSAYPVNLSLKFSLCVLYHTITVKTAMEITIYNMQTLFLNAPEIISHLAVYRMHAYKPQFTQYSIISVSACTRACVCIHTHTLL